MTAESFAAFFPPNPAKHGRLVRVWTDREGRLQKNSKTCDGEPVTCELIQEHLCGSSRFAALGYLPGGPEGTTVGMIDLDLKHFAPPDVEAAANTRAADSGTIEHALLRLTDVAEAMGLHVYLEQSTRGGWHIYTFTDAALPHAAMKAALKAWQRRAELVGMEVYPAGEDHLSTWQIMPYAGAAKDPQGLGRTYLQTPDGEAIRLDELGEWVQRTPAGKLYALAMEGAQATGQREVVTTDPVDLAPAALELLKEAAGKPPASFERHGSLSSFVNLGRRCGREAEMLDYLQSDTVRQAWVKDGSRTPQQWRDEVERWAKAKRAGFERGIKYLLDQGFTIPDLPKQTPEDAEPWGELGPLPPLAPDPDDLPAELIPAPLRPWLEDAARRACVHLAFIAVVAVAALGAVVGRSLGMYPKQRDDWLEVPNMWAAITAPPSSGKSPALSEGIRHVARLAARAREAFEAEQAEHAAQAEVLKLELAALKKQASGKKANAKDFHAEIRDKLQELQDLEAVTARRYILNDATMEKTGELLRDNPRGLLYVRDELIGLLKQCDKPGHETDRAFLLEAWNGRGAFTFDRIGRGTLHIPAVTLSLCGGIQPGRLRSYIAGALQESEEADGLLQRFQLLVWFDQPLPWQSTDTPPDTAARDRAFKVYEYLDALDPAAMGALVDPHDPNSIPALRFDEEAQALFTAWHEALMQRLRGPDLQHAPAFLAHLGKYPALMPSLALLFHLTDLAARQAATLTPVSFEAAALAVDWCEYLEQHARKVYAQELDHKSLSAHALAEKIRQGEVEDGGTLKDIYRHGWAELKTAEDVGAAVEALEAANWVRVATLQPGGQGGRPSRVLRLHPELRGL